MVNDKQISNDGNNNRLAIGSHNTFVDLYIHSSEKIKKGIMFQLLDNICNITVDSSKVLPPDTTPYTMEDKISYNEIDLYSNHYDYFQEGFFIIQEKIRDAEENLNGKFEESICRYIQGHLISVIEVVGDREKPDVIIKSLKSNITTELKEHYKCNLSPEEVNYIPYVIYYVFARCKIFEKPPIHYVNTE